MANQQQPMYVNHILHILLCLLTGGLWLIIYIPILIAQGKEAKRLQQR